VARSSRRPVIPAIPQAVLGKMVLASVDMGYVAIPKIILDAVEDPDRPGGYPLALLGLPWCAMVKDSGGWLRYEAQEVDLLCTLEPGHEGLHGWDKVQNLPVEGSHGLGP
jgi:hypothetical protein